MNRNLKTIDINQFIIGFILCMIDIFLYAKNTIAVNSGACLQDAIWGCSLNQPNYYVYHLVILCIVLALFTIYRVKTWIKIATAIWLTLAYNQFFAFIIHFGLISILIILLAVLLLLKEVISMVIKSIRNK